MTPLPPFAVFFRELWGYDPFPWQTMLTERVSNDRWPAALDLPTAAGKTACIDIAIYTLAAQADLPLARRAAPRRVWFVVDRRIVVDQAYDRAQQIAACLRKATPGSALAAVAERLRRLSGTGIPLGVGRLRGGVLHDEGYALVPSQPAVITSTVDQLGSRLLFRAYGSRSQLTAPVYAGLAANDSLVILDEAHCSVPFMQTLQAIERYRGSAWARHPLVTPFGVVIMSATPPAGVPHEAVFPGARRKAALEHPILDRRLHTPKWAQLVGPLKSSSRRTRDPLVAETVRRALGYINSNYKRVAIMVNRICTAEETAQELQAKTDNSCDVVLLTGRIRPYERDRLVQRWMPLLRATGPDDPARPIVVVSTQCLEVGADFSFDALVTEAASLDALRQRFGRLARMGADEPAPAAIVVRDSNIAGKQPDPIYGAGIARTWEFLQQIMEPSNTSHHAEPIVDFGVYALDANLDTIDDISTCLAPVDDAPILLPAHVDVLVETAPTAYPAPDIGLFLHGKGVHASEVQVVWRADLSPTNEDTWIESVSLCRPVSSEMLSIPLHRLRMWLRESSTPDDDSDIEGGATSTETVRDEIGASMRPSVLWRGRRRGESKIARKPEDIRPGDVVVVPDCYGTAGIMQNIVGHQAAAEAVGNTRLDLWEAAQAASGRPTAVRLSRDVLDPWLACPPVKELMSAVDDEADRGTLAEAIAGVLACKPEAGGASPAPPEWWLKLLKMAHSGHWRLAQHPAGGVILFAKADKKHPERWPELDNFADADDLTSIDDQEIVLDDHSSMVHRAVERTAALCLSEDLVEPLCEAAKWHDVGKLDDRFQAVLRHGDMLAARSADHPIAKSTFIPSTPSQRRAVRRSVGLPDNFRHEMLSMQLLQDHLSRTAASDGADLTLHLVASHHGYARPFAPVCDDPDPVDISGVVLDRRIELTSGERRDAIPAHHLASGVAERFWTLVRHYGWWGLAYLEAVLRLGDWYASAYAERAEDRP